MTRGLLVSHFYTKCHGTDNQSGMGSSSSDPYEKSVVNSIATTRGIGVFEDFGLPQALTSLCFKCSVGRFGQVVRELSGWSFSVQLSSFRRTRRRALLNLT